MLLLTLQVRPCKISVITYGKTNYYCGEECFAKLRRFKNIAPDESEPSNKETEVQPVPEIQPGPIPVPVSEPVPVSIEENITQNVVSEVSEENLENDKQATVIPQDRAEFVRKCSQCSSIITADERTLSWETMDFCHEDCLGKILKCILCFALRYVLNISYIQSKYFGLDLLI